MTEELKEVIEAVENINQQLFDQIGQDQIGPLTITTEPLSGYQVVEWLGEALWNSEDEGREYIEDHDEFKGDWEPLEPYLRKKIMELILGLSKNKVVNCSVY